MNKLDAFNKIQIRPNIPEIRTGDTVKIHQKVKAGDKRKSQVFEGLVIAKKHGKGTSAMITVRKVTLGVGVERIFPLHSPNIEKIEVIKRGKTRRSKLYYLRMAKGRKAKLKTREFFGEAPAVGQPIAETEGKEEEEPKKEKQEIEK